MSTSGWSCRATWRRAGRLAALLTALLLPVHGGLAAPPEQTPPTTRNVLRAAQLEPLPPTQSGGRFQLNARLEAAPIATAGTDAGPLRLTAVLVPKADVAFCPTPGTVFFDGFESP